MAQTILLVRDDLNGLPVAEAPPGYRLRTYREGDAVTWAGLIAAAFPEFDWTEDRFRSTFLDRPQFSPEILFFAIDEEGVAVATAMAWVEDSDRLDSGCVHWVAVHPNHQRRGLGRFLTVTVLHRFKERGLPKAHLWTESYREDAIQLYAGLGFRKVT